MKVLAVPCEIYSRVVGYYRPVSLWNDGKKQEFSERAEIKVSRLLAFQSESKPLQEESNEEV